MSWLLRSTKSKLLSSSSSLSRTFSSLPRSTYALDRTAPPQIAPLSPVLDLFHCNTTTIPIAKEKPSGGKLIGDPKDHPANKLGIDFDTINVQMYKASGRDTNVPAGAIDCTVVRARRGLMHLGVNAGMARSFAMCVEVNPLGLRRYMSDMPNKTSETKPSGFRPLSPHLPLYQPQLSATLSIFNRIAGAFLAAVILLFYMIYMKLGLVSLTYDSFYQFIFYSSKLNLLAIELSALAVSYHLYSAIRHLFV